MKKNGFTLAEVLITLAIIGVVATLTLPSLITNTGEQQAISAFKKGINTLTEAAQMNSTLAGFDYSGVVVDQNDATLGKVVGGQSIYGLLTQRAAVDLVKSESTTEKMRQNGADMVGTNYTIFFKDGSSISYPKDAKIGKTYKTGDSGVATGTIQSDGLPYGIAVLYDTNGLKGPNITSNCNGNLSGEATEKAYASKTPAQACEGTNKSQRVIRDQFGVRLRGSYAVPNGVAARWAFNQ